MMVGRALPGVLLLVAAVGCGSEVKTDVATLAAAPAPAAERSLTKAAPEMTTLTTVLYSERDAETRTRIDGIVASIRAELGDGVRAGEILGTLRDEREVALVESAKAALELARNTHERAAELRKQDLVTQAELEQAVYRLRSAEADLRKAEVELEYTRMRAPFDGVVAQRYIRIGQAVEEDDLLFRITAPRPLRARVLVPELEASGLRPGQSLRLSGVSGTQVTGEVVRIAPAVDPVSGTLEVLLNVNDPKGLRPGSAVTVTLAEPARAAR